MNKRVKMGNSGDYIVRATAAGGQIRAFAATTGDLVETARQAHNLSPVVTAALGRTLTAGAMMGAMMKDGDDLLTLQIRGSGPMKGLTVTAGAPDEKTGTVSVKGYALVPDVILPAKFHAHGSGGNTGSVEAGSGNGECLTETDAGKSATVSGHGSGYGEYKLDVGGAIGIGVLSVIRDLGLKDPYIGQVALQTGEIAEDLTYYFATSEQVPSAVGLGVLMDKGNTVKHAGGFIIQLMPSAEDAVITKLERVLSNMPSVTSLLDEGRTPEGILEYILDGYDIEFNDMLPARFYCNCDKERVEKALISIGKKELDDILSDGRDIELRCHFCGKAYNFTLDEVEDIRRSI